MEKHLSLVKLETRPYRVVAQENWGLTDEQMKGCHVHHRVPRSEGGTNDPSNLFVCSPSMHRWGWHNGEAFVEWGTKAAEVRDKKEHKETSRKAGLKTVSEGLGLFGRTPEKVKEDAKKAASKSGKLPWWYNPDTGEGTRSETSPGEGWSRGRRPEVVAKTKRHLVPGNPKAAAAQHATRWRCLVTGKVSTPCGLSNWQKARGIDRSLRERVKPVKDE